MTFRNLLLPIALSLLLAGCASRERFKAEHFADFLNEYSFEQTGEGDDALFSYWNKQVSWRTYNKIIVDPIITDIDQNSNLRRMAHAERIQLQEYIEFHLRENLRQNFKLVNSQGENTLRIRVAITDADAATELIEMFSVIHPPPQNLQALAALSASKGLRGTKANLKAELSDSTTGDLLMAAANANEDDEPWGSFPFDGNDIQQLCKGWIKHLSYELCRHKGRIDCELPK